MRISRTYAALLLLLGLSMLQQGCRRTSPLKSSRPNIVLLVIDALRKDHVSSYGYDRATTPAIDSLARRGVLFENAVAQAPWTPPSMASLLTSRRPLAVGVHATEQESGMRDLEWGRVTELSGHHTTLIELLEDGGYSTLCVTGNHLASHHLNLDQGCQRYVLPEPSVGGRSDRLVDEAAAFLEEHVNGERRRGMRRPFFLYMHFMDVHEPNNPPSPYDDMYPTLDDAPHRKKHRKWGWTRLEDPGSRKFRIFRSHKVALYDGSLSFADAQIARLLVLLEKWGLRKDTVVVIASDHGEELWDHALLEQEYREDPRGRYGVGHGHTMFRELLEVPLVMYGAGVPEGVRVEEQVRNLDIMPTLLGLARLPAPGVKMDGVDLLERIEAKSLEDMVAFSEDITYGHEEKCIQDARFKYIRGRDYEFLFDKQEDPGETRSVIEEHPGPASTLAGLLDVILAGPVGADGAPMPMDEETLEHLRYLGYVE